MKCEICKEEIIRLEEDDFGEPIDWNTAWEQYLCDVCRDKIWKALLDNACDICETEPCKRGRGCWVNPWPRIMYLCYIAPRKKQTKIYKRKSFPDMSLEEQDDFWADKDNVPLAQSINSNEALKEM